MSTTPPRPSKALFWTGWVLSVLPAAMMSIGAVLDITKADFVVKELTKHGFPESSIVPLGAVTLTAILLYLIPQTSVLGAIVLTGYLGGAVSLHLSSGDPLGNVFAPVVFGTILWLGLVLRDPRVRSVLPIRR